MNKLTNVTTKIAKVLEVVFWCADIAMVVLMIALVAMKDQVSEFISSGLDNGTLTIQGMNVNVIDDAGQLMTGSMFIVALTGLITFTLIAMVFRNVYLIFQTAAGKTKFSKGATPFQEANIRMVREIGIFSIAVPVVELVMGIIAGIVAHGADVTVSLNGAVFGIVILCLSQFFAYGAKLQDDVDGLL